MMFYFLAIALPPVLHLLVFSLFAFYLLADLITTNHLITLIAIQGGTSLMLTFIMGVFYKNHLIRMVYLGSILDHKSFSLRPAGLALARPFREQYRFEQRVIARLLKRVERRLHVRS